MVRCNGCGCEWSGDQKPFPNKIEISKHLSIGDALSAVRFNAILNIQIDGGDNYGNAKIASADLCETCIAKLRDRFFSIYTGVAAAEAAKKEIMEHVEGLRESMSTHASRVDAHLRNSITDVQAKNIMRVFLEENFGPMLDAHREHRRTRKKGAR
jgi:hypothetical protein